MARAEGLRHVSIGQYLPTGSVVHRLDPRAKLLISLVVVTGVIVTSRYVGNLVLLALVFGLLWLARVPLRYTLAPIMPAAPIILVLSLFQMLFYRDPTGLERVLFGWGGLVISTGSIRIVVVAWMRLLGLVVLTGIITGSTSSGALSYALEWILRPLSRLRLPGHELAMVGAIALRFMPILGEQMESIMMAQASRGVGERPTDRWRLLRNAQRMAELLIPLFVDAFRRSEEMVLAMQARCYRGGRGRTHLVDHRFGGADWMALLASAALVALAIWCQWAGLP